jgi:ribonuclease-3
LDGELQAALGYRFRDPALLERALTHRSFAHEAGKPVAEAYERLEFLGDALLGFIVSHWLWQDDRSAPEGTLTRRKQAVVRTDSLASAARALGLGEALHLGRGELRTGGRAKPSLLADVFEAVLGAIYIDGGIRPARSFVRRHLREAMQAAGQLAEVADDYKTRLQERVQARLRSTPAYRIVRKSGLAHAPEFTAEVRVEGEVLGVGTGSSRKQAEQEAAREALAHYDG